MSFKTSFAKIMLIVSENLNFNKTTVLSKP